MRAQMMTMDSLMADSDAVLPSWVARLDNATLIADVGAATFTRAVAYAQQARVESVSAGEHGALILASVRGSGAKRYQTLVRRVPDDASDECRDDAWTAHCTCPVSVDCKHAVAVLLTVRDRLRAEAHPVAARTGPAVVPAWERTLAGMVRQQPESHDPPNLGLMLEPSGVAQSPRVRLRPVVPGRSGRWVTTGVSWRDIEQQYGYPKITRQARDALLPIVSGFRANVSSYMYGYGDVAIHLDDLGPVVWHLLREVERSGVPLLSSRDGTPVELSEPAEPVLDLVRATPLASAKNSGGHSSSDDLVARAHIRLSDGTSGPVGELTLVGDPVHGVVLDLSGRLVLAPLSPPLDASTAALMRGGGLRVPADDIPRFMSSYYPALRERLRVVSSDGSVELPEIRPPRLAVSVGIEQKHETLLHWSFVYETDGQAVVAPLRGPTDVPRQRTAEESLLAGPEVLDKVPALRTVVGSRRELVPDVRLHGLDTVTFVTDVLPVLLDDDEILVEVTGTAPDYSESLGDPVISVSTRDDDAAESVGTDWFDLDIIIDVDSHRVPLRDVLGAVARGESHLILDSGAWFRLDRPEFATLNRLVSEAQSLQESDSEQLRISRWQAGLWDELVELGVVGEQSQRWSRCVSGLLDLAEIPKPEPPSAMLADLRPYQLDGYQWLSLLWDHELGGVLADDMGLGKTLQTLAVLARAHENGTLGAGGAPALIVAPTSVVGTWVSEARRFFPQLTVAAVTETFRRSGVPLGDVVKEADVVVTSYSLVRIEDEAYRAIDWSGLVLDEAQFVKNHRAKTYQAVRRIRAPFRLALTGTPLENTLMDLWSVLSVAAPGLFPSPQHFDETYRKPIEKGRSMEQLATLQRRIRPLMLRRTKEQVAADLPPKIEQTLEVTLNPAHRRVYDRHLQRERMRVLGLIDDMDRNRIAIFKSLTTLRRLCLDASLVDDASAG